MDQNILDEVERLASLSFAPNQIAKILEIKRAAFTRLYADKSSTIREAYDRGILKTEEKKMKILKKRMKKSMTALQEHNKREADIKFQALKSEIFEI